MRSLFPDIKPYAVQSLAVDDLHTLHIEECGRPNGLPVLFLHGGPGAGCDLLALLRSAALPHCAV